MSEKACFCNIDARDLSISSRSGIVVGLLIKRNAPRAAVAVPNGENPGRRDHHPPVGDIYNDFSLKFKIHAEWVRAVIFVTFPGKKCHRNLLAV